MKHKEPKVTKSILKRKKKGNVRGFALPDFKT